MLRVLHVSPSYFPAVQFGGPIQSVHLLNKSLATNGIAVDVFTTNAGLEDKPEYQSSIWKGIDGVRVKYFSYYGYIHYNFSPKLLTALFKEVSNYDLVHITAIWNFPVWAAATACIRANVPYIISPRGTIYPETVALKSTFFKMSYYWLFARRCLRQASAIHYTALDEQRKVDSFLQLKNKSFVIPNGLDLKIFSETNQISSFSVFFPELLGKKYILYLSRINIKKGLDLLVSAFAKVSEHFPELMLVIAGPDNEGYGFEVRKALKRANLLSKTIFPGMLNGEAKLAAYKDAELFVLPSYSENFGMSVVEAMACGTPVVISDQVGIAREIESNGAGIIVKTDSECIKKAIISLLEQTANKRLIAEKGARMVKDFYNINAVSKSFIKQYQTIINSYEKKNYRIR